MAKPVLGRGLSALLGGKPSAASKPAVVAPASAPSGPEVIPSNPFAPVASPGPNPSPSPAGSSTATVGAPNGGVEWVPVGRVKPSALQPRREFPAESLAELADSIREQGILQPLIVRRSGDHLELIAGERRWRASQLAGLTEVPVIVREADDTTALELMLVENLQREDLNPMDEAQGYAELMSRFALTQDGVATRVGRSRAAVANALRLLRLPADVQDHLRFGRVSTGHAKVLLGLPTSEGQGAAAKRVLAEGLSVRQTEELVARLSAPPPPVAAGPRPAPSEAPVTLRDPNLSALEDRLRQRFGTRVNLRYRQGRGQIDIRFFSDDELERVLEIVGVHMD